MHQKMFAWLSALTISALLIGACSPTPTPAVEPTAAPEPTEAPAVEEPTAAPAPTEAPAVEEPTAEPEPLTIGLIMVGTANDRGWNQAHHEAVQYVAERIPGTQVIEFENLNVGVNPDLTVEQVADDMVEQGADLIITNSAEFKEGTNAAAAAHPDVYFIHASGDAVLTGEAPENVANIMGEMEYMKMIAGCTAALSSESGNLAYLGPLVDAETQRLVNSAYLGARYCWDTHKADAGELSFRVTWIGFWFNIPGVTLDPTVVVNGFIADGADVLISGIDTPEVLTVGQQADGVFSVPYDFEGACEGYEAICLGVPYFNWGPSYLSKAQQIVDGAWTSDWQWLGPNWENMADKDTSNVGWVNGPALSADNAALLAEFEAGLADGSINLYTGPLNYADGSVFVADGEALDLSTTEGQSVLWYTEQLLEGIRSEGSTGE